MANILTRVGPVEHLDQFLKEQTHMAQRVVEGVCSVVNGGKK